MEELFINEIWPIIKWIIYVGGGLFVCWIIFMVIAFFGVMTRDQ